MVKALRRAGFVKARKSTGSHQAMVKAEPPPPKTAIVPLGKKQVARYTLRQIIINQAGMTVAEFRSFLR